MSLKSATVIVTNPTVSNPTTATIEQPASPSSQPSMAAEKPKADTAQPVETTASTPGKAAYVWDPVAALANIMAKRDEGIITLTPNADGTAYTVTGDTKKVRGYLKGLNAKWDPETTNWTLPALALTDPTAASNERNAILAERSANREARRAERAEAAPAKPATKKAEPKKADPKPTSKTYTADEVQQLITKAVCAAFSMMGNMANNEKAIAALTAKLLSA